MAQIKSPKKQKAKTRGPVNRGRAKLRGLRARLKNMQARNQQQLATADSRLRAHVEASQSTSDDLSSLLAGTDIAVVFLDPLLRVRRYTPQARELLDLTPSHIGRPLAEVVRKFTDPPFDADARDVLARGEMIKREVVADGGRHFIRRLLPHRTADNRIEGLIITFMDITDRTRTEEELQASKAAAEEANRLKDEFLATLSHELRTPLGAILLWAKLLENEGMTNPQQLREGISAIKTSAEAQKELIEDLLDMSRITLGNLRLKPREVELLPVLHDALEAIKPAAAAKSLTVKTDLAADAGVVLIDPDRIRQVVWNLLTNAVKFTPAGGHLEVGLRRHGAEIEIWVKDNGKGIDPAFLPHVFERFRQAETSHSQFQGGIGLGLAIARQLVELHGGIIVAESGGLNRGAKFTVRLPLPAVGNRSSVVKRAGAVVPRRKTRASDLKGVKILFVEDDRETRSAVAGLLQRIGIAITEADSASAAMKFYQESRFDLILSDIGMPVEDGYTLIRRIRNLETARRVKPVPAVALTAFARETDRQMAIEAGFAKHLGKPVDFDEMLSAIRDVLRNGAAEQH